MVFPPSIACGNTHDDLVQDFGHIFSQKFQPIFAGAELIVLAAWKVIFHGRFYFSLTRSKLRR